MTPATLTDRWIPSTCGLCYGTCSILGHQKNGVLVKIEGNPESAVGRGRLCGKGVSGIMTLYDPNRLDVPLRRTNPEKGKQMSRWAARGNAMSTKGRKLVPFYVLCFMALLVVPSMGQYQPPLTPSEPRVAAPEPLAPNLVINGDFEAGTLTGWTVRDQTGGDGSWFIQMGASSPGSGFGVPSPPQGTFAAMTDQFGPGSHILYQDITLPSGQPATLSFALYIVNRSVSFVIPTFPTLDFTVFPNQHFRVDIMDPSAPVDSVTTGVLKNVYITEPGDPLESGYTTTTASLDAFAGRQIRLRFAEVDNQGYFQVAIDKVIISGSPLASLTISPGSGSFVQTQRFDLTLILEASPGVGVTGGSATLDGGDVTGALVSCIDGHIGTLTGTRTGLTFRCPDVPASIFSVSSHTFAVRLTLSDGNAVSASVTWEIIGNQE